MNTRIAFAKRSLPLTALLILAICISNPTVQAQQKSIKELAQNASAHTALQPNSQNDPGVRTLKDSYEEPTDYKHQVFNRVETSPKFPGGMQKLYEFFFNHIQYPAEAQQKQVQGRVIVQFVVERNGSLSNIVALRGPDYGLNEEAVRVLKQSPKWTPGMVKGHKVRTQFAIPIYFKL